jgi:Fic family protein
MLLFQRYLPNFAYATVTTTLDEDSRRGELVEQRWDVRLDALGGRNARRGFAYQAYVPTPIGDEEFALGSTIAAAAANAEAATLSLNTDPPRQLNFEALARQLLRAESVASSRIEGLVLGHRRLARAAFSPERRDLTAESVLANIAALEAAIELASGKAITREDLVEVHRVLMAGTRDEHLGGVIREEPNWIGGEASSPRHAEFVPPPHELVPALLDDLCEFMNRDDVPVVIQAAIAHAQFETIHPFHDGNGRLGRALILALLRRRGIAPRYLPPVSLALAGSADRYVTGLTSFRNGNEEDWYAVFVDAVYNSATRARAFAEEVAALQDHWVEQAGQPRANSGPRRLIELLPSNPLVDVRTATQLLGGTGEQARQAILRLAKAGVLRQVNLGKSNRVWETVGLFDLLDRFERDLGPGERAPRPTR